MNLPTDTWFVSVRRPNSGAYVRNSNTFQNETAAKEFARKMVDAGFEITAGTISPHRPKKAIGPWQVSSWLDEV